MAQQRQIAPPVYLVALAFLLIPPFDSLMQALPPRLSDPKWRFGIFGLESNALMLPMAGLLIAFMATVYFEHRTFQKVLGILSTICAVVLIAALGFFALDAVQLHTQVPSQATLAFRVATMTAVLKSLLGIFTLVAFSYASFKAPKPPRPPKASRTPGLIIPSEPSTPIAAGPIAAAPPAAITAEAEPEIGPT